MSDSYSQYNFNKYVKGNRLGPDQTLEDSLRDRISLWENNNLSSGVQQVFIYYGKPGVGKSWLLSYLRDRIFKNAVYVNLQDRKNFPSSMHFLRKFESGELKDTSSMKKLFLIDHVPDTRTDEALKLFEEKILIPYYQGGSLFIFAQQHPRNWCWSGAIPHPDAPFTLNGFNEKGRKELCKKYGISLNAKETLFNMQETYPLLVALKSDGASEIKVANEYLHYWLSQLDTPALDYFDDDIRFSGALTWLSSIADTQGLINLIQKLGRTDDHIDVRERLSQRQWVTPLDVWEEPVRTALQIWFRHNHSDLVRTLDVMNNRRS
jgi:hypothetical protein